MADPTTLPGYGMPLYGSPAPRDLIVQALMSGGQSMAPQQPNSAGGNFGTDIQGMLKNNPKLLDGLKKWFAGTSAPSNNMPGTGLFGTNLGGTPWAQAAAPGPNQIAPM